MAVNFSNIFGQSPIEPLKNHMVTVMNCTQHLINFTEYHLQQNWEQADKVKIAISNLEHTADQQKKELKIHMPKSLFLPIPRGDLLKILDAQDGIANKAEDIASIVIGRKIIIPTVIQELYLQFIQRAVHTTEQANLAIQEIDKLLSTGFSGKEIRIVSNMIENLDDLERQTDETQGKIRNILFIIEKELPPIECMFLYKLIELISDVADRSQTVGGQLQLLLAK